MRTILTVMRPRIRAVWMPQQQASAPAKKGSSGDVFFVETSDAGSHKDVLPSTLDIEAAFCSTTGSRKTQE